LKVLQLTGDWKWTGPAEPMVQLALGLRERGHTVDLACAAPPPGEDRGVAIEAARRGVAPLLTFAAGRGVRPIGDAGVSRTLARLVRSERYDVVHAWHTRDHVLALRARGLRSSLFGAPAVVPAVVRSWRRAEPPGNGPWTRWLFGSGCEGLVCVSPGAAAAAAPLRGGRPVAGCFGAVDLETFRPDPGAETAREALGLPPEALVVGIVARIQPHRRFDVLLDAAARLFEAEPRARLVVVGRGTRRTELAEEPARRLGIADRVVFAGWRGPDYGAVLRSIDLFTFLVPGSDGTCRALLEAAACGIPAVTSRRGALPEIVSDGETGVLVDETPEALAAAWLLLLRDPARRRELGANARKRAESAFTPGRFAAEVEALYGEVLGE
jgi:glycosyltransferase involved in cell wall biosynthesis